MRFNKNMIKFYQKTKIKKIKLLNKKKDFKILYKNQVTYQKKIKIIKFKLINK